MGVQIISAGSGPQYPLIVDASGAALVKVIAGSITISTGDIEIGAVELKDQASDNRATIIGSALLTLGKPAGLDTGSAYGIASGVQSNIAVHKITSGTTYYLFGFHGTGTADGTFRLFTDSTPRMVLKNNWCERNIGKVFNHPIPYTASTVGSVIVAVTHAEAGSQSYDGNIIGVEI